MSDEKSVIIPYDRWNSYYKVLENKNLMLERELKTEKDRNSFHLYVRIQSLPMFHGRDYEDWYNDKPFAKISIDPISRSKIVIADTEYTQDIINYVIRRGYDKHIVTSDKIEKAIADGEKGVSEHYQSQVKKIPAFIRWLFKIKSHYD